MKLFVATLALCILSLNVVAQEPEANTESSSAISSNSRSSEVPLYSSRDMRNKSLVAAAMSDEAQWLETEHGKILALYRPTEARKTTGLLILFHAAESPQYWPPMLENLRANLPRYGWETLAVSLPQKYPNTIPERPESSFSASASSAIVGEESAAETTAQEEPLALSSSSFSAASSAVTRELLITAYVDAAFNFVKNKDQFNVVVLTDNSSAYQILQNLAPQIKENKRDTTTVDGPLQALVIANLQQNEPITKQELEAMFGTKQLPVLDLFFAPDNAEQRESRELHKAVAMRKKVTVYQQLLIDNQSKLLEQDHQNYVLGRVRGFIQQKASGTELSSPKNEPE